MQATGVAPTDDGFTVIKPGAQDVDRDGASFVGAADVLLRHARGGFEFARRLGGGLTRIAKRRHQTGPRLGARIEGFVGERDGPGDPGGVGCGRGEEA